MAKGVWVQSASERSFQEAVFVNGNRRVRVLDLGKKQGFVFPGIPGKGKSGIGFPKPERLPWWRVQKWRGWWFAHHACYPPHPETVIVGCASGPAEAIGWLVDMGYVRAETV